MEPEVSSKNTKAQILVAYNRLSREHQELQGKFEELRKEKRAAVPAPEPRAKEPKPLVEMITGATIGDIVGSLDHLRASFGSAISELSAKLTAEATRLAELRQAVESETTQLGDVYDLEVVEGLLDELIRTHIGKSDHFDEEMNQKRQAFEQGMADRRKAWQDEQQEHTRSIEERSASLKIARQREAAAYKYERERTRKQDADTYEANTGKLDAELDEFLQSKNREWQEREEAIAEQENLFERYRSEVEAFPEKLDAAVKKAAAEGRRPVESEAKVRTDLRATEVEGEKQIYELRVQSLEETIEKQATQIENLSKQLNAVLKQAQDLAVKALEGASSASTYQAVKEMAREMAKNVPVNE